MTGVDAPDEREVATLWVDAWEAPRGLVSVHVVVGDDSGNVAVYDASEALAHVTALPECVRAGRPQQLRASALCD